MANKLVGKFKDHEILHNHKEFVIRHPATCPRRGSNSDKYCTFHGYWVLDEAMHECGLDKASTLILKQINTIQKEHEQTQCGFKEAV